ncbi:MAG: NAD-dependent epimerase/dehydratase family protein [Armatimonadota bacterium]
MQWYRKLDAGKILRMTADVLIVNFSLAVAVIAHYLWIVGVGGVQDASAALRHHAIRLLQHSLTLTPITLAVFWWSGFYTRSRLYRGRYKAIIITQAVTLVYVLAGFFAYLVPAIFAFQRTTLILGWLVTLVVCLAVRLGHRAWKTFSSAERRYLSAPLADRPPRNVLVIGGAGYIGSALIPKLLEKGYYVRLLDLFLYGIEPIAPYINHPRLDIVRADFRQVDKVVQCMQGMDAVIHLGGIVGDPACAIDEELTIEVNLVATRTIAEIAKGFGISRFIFASTCSVYGSSDELLDERSALNPVSLYARSKIASERVLLSLASPTFSPTILRFGTIYGLSGRIRFDLVVNLLTAKAVVDGKITIFGSDQWRPFVHVDDAATAVLKVLEAPLPLVRNQILNVGSDSQNYTLRQVGEIIHRLVPTAELIVMGSDGDKRNYRVNFSKIRRLLDFTPRWTLEQGIQQVIDALNSSVIQDYRDARYSNVKFLSEEGVSRLIKHENGWAHALIQGTPYQPTTASYDAE